MTNLMKNYIINEHLLIILINIYSTSKGQAAFHQHSS